MTKDIKTHPKYWHFHKEIYYNEFDSLDDEIREGIQQNPNSNDARRFNEKVNQLVSDRIKDSNN
jgi:hypothetical protein